MDSNKLELVTSFFVPSKPKPKPRMTRRDKWAKRDIVMSYRAWEDLVALMWKIHKKNIKLHDVADYTFEAIGIGIDFYMPGVPRGDLDNYQKGIFEALSKARVVKDDRSKYIVFSDRLTAYNICNDCKDYKNKEKCHGVTRCDKGGANIYIYRPKWERDERWRAGLLLALKEK